jgi:cobalt-zinc-cadmium efflux system membrane fusion protein
VPAALAFVTLGGLLAWGHLTGWTLPSFAALTGQEAAAPEDWCASHGVPESQCVECRPDLLPRPQAFGWCATHGVHECPWCHPEVAQTERPPAIPSEDLARVQVALDLIPRTENNPKCKLHQRRIQFVHEAAVARAGIDVEPVWTAAMVEALTASGEITYDPTLTARLAARVPGSVFQVLKQVGDPVKKGEVVALLDAAEVGKAKAEFLQALVQVRWRTKTAANLASLAGAGGGTERALLEAQAALGEAQIRLTAAQLALTNLGLPARPERLQAVADADLVGHVRFLGLPAALAQTLDPATTTANLLPVVAPLDGVVVAREAVAGEAADAGKVLFVVVDARRLWLTLDVRAEDVRLVAPGQEVRFRPDGGEETRGAVTWISTEADPRTRAVKVRALLDNPQGRLRANTFGAGRVVLREERRAVVVPNAAVHWDGCCHVVFVRNKEYFRPGAPKVFYVRTVRPGARDERQTEILAGVLPGEVVAARGSGALRSELLRANLGAG